MGTNSLRLRKGWEACTIRAREPPYSHPKPSDRRGEFAWKTCRFFDVRYANYTFKVSALS